MRPIPYWRLSGFYFFHFAFIGAFAPYWSLYLKSLSFSAFQIGMLMSLLHVTRIFAPAAWGWLADHTGRRLMIVQAAALMGLISYCGVFLGESFAWMFAIMALMSFFWSASLPLIEATTLSYLGESTARYGRIRVWGSVGFIFAVTGTGYLLDASNIASLLWAVLGFKLGIVIFSRQIPEAEVMVHPADGTFRPADIQAPGSDRLFRGLHADGACPWPLLHFLFDLPGGARLHQEHRGLAMGDRRDLRNRDIFSDAAADASLQPKTDHGFQFQLRHCAVFDDRLGSRLADCDFTGASTACCDVRRPPCHIDVGGAPILSGAGTRQRDRRFTPVSHSGWEERLGGLFSGYAWEWLGPGLTFTVSSIAVLLGLALVVWKMNVEPI